MRRLVDLALTDAVTREATWLEFRVEPTGIAVHYGLPAGPAHTMQIPAAAGPSILSELLSRLGKPADAPLPVAGTLTIRTPTGTASAHTVVALQAGVPVARLELASQAASTGPAAAT